MSAASRNAVKRPRPVTLRRLDRDPFVTRTWRFLKGPFKGRGGGGPDPGLTHTHRPTFKGWRLPPARDGKPTYWEHDAAVSARLRAAKSPGESLP